MKKLIITSLSLALTATALSPFSAAASGTETATEARPSFETQKSPTTRDFMSIIAGDEMSTPTLKKDQYSLFTEKVNVTEEKPYLSWEVGNTHKSDDLLYTIMDEDYNSIKVGVLAPGDSRKFTGVKAPVGTYTLYLYSLGEIDESLGLEDFPVPSGYAELKSVQVESKSKDTTFSGKTRAKVKLYKDDNSVSTDTVAVSDEDTSLTWRVGNDGSSTLPIFYYIIDQKDNYIAHGSVKPGETDGSRTVKVAPGEYKLYLVDSFKNEAEGELITVSAH